MCAFTLAEVLITLGIIGVVAAVTMPTLIQNHQKHATAVKVKKFYSIINQAYRMSYIDNGDPVNWVEANKKYNHEELNNWLNIYLLPYIKYIGLESKTTQTDDSTEPYIYIRLADGSLFGVMIDTNGQDISYYVNGKIEITSRNYFKFQFAKKNNDSIISTNFVEPYIYGWDGTREQLKEGYVRSCYKGCTNCQFCTKLLEQDGWQFSDDYPW